MAYDVLSHFEEHTEPAGVDPVFRPIAEWSVWRVDIGDLGRGNVFIDGELVELGAALVIVDADQREQARMPLDFRRRIIGRSVVVVEGSDQAGVLGVAAGIRLEDPGLQLTLTLGLEGRTPAEALPALRFLSRLRPESRVGLWLDALQDWAAAPVPWMADPAVEEGYLDAVETLDQVQRATGTSFPIPLEFTTDDLEDLRRAATLLSGDVLTSTWTEGTIVLGQEWADGLLGSVGAFVERGTYDVTIGDHDVRVGVVTQSVLFALAEQERPAPDGTGRVRMRVVASSHNNRIERELVKRAFFDPFARDLERVVISENDVAGPREGQHGRSLRDDLRSA